MNKSNTSYESNINFLTQLQHIKLNLDIVNNEITSLINQSEPCLTLNSKLPRINARIKTCREQIDKIHAQQYRPMNKNPLKTCINKTLLSYYNLILKLKNTRSFILLKSFMSPKIGKLNLYLPTKMIIPKFYYAAHKQAHNSKISIVTPSYNQGIYLERTIQSVLTQHYKQLEYIIQDGGSTDNTMTILKNHTTQLHHWESKKDTGQTNALNLGFKHTSGEIMAYLNSDDILLPGTLHYVADYFSKHPEVDVIYGHRILINEHDQEIGRWVLPRHESEILKWADYIPQETLFWRRRIWDKVGATFDEHFKFAMDWDLILRFQSANATFARVPRFLGAFRIHTQQKTSTQISDIGIEEMRRLRERANGRPVHYKEVSKKLRGYLFRHWVVHRLYKAGLLNY